ncbi:hypothetical protein [Legionella fallonii]|uniref:Uncharacterized protein n=1 Tax=Legionella fallonii LLAP-10 TaxID=1212491 RepID=A0A098FZR9_9GAMM|nr:hypothetical protein [Legionella fallonii]CEG55728.1 protein of unknown function [coiled-coil domain] [Legionella fallonii LLAP-10]
MKTNYLSAKNNSKAVNDIKEAIQNILTLDEEAISLYCPKVFNKLDKVHKNSIFETLTEQDFLDIINELKQSLPKISADIEKIKKKLEPLEQRTLDDQGLRIMEKMQVNSARMHSIQDQLKTPMPEKPGAWSRFIADKNPGFLKSIFLFFVPQTAIENAQKACDNYDKEAINRWNLTVERRALNSENEKLKTSYHASEKQIEQRDAMQQNLQELSGGQLILQQATQQLEEHFNNLVPKADAARAEQQLDLKELEELEELMQELEGLDDELQFSMEL